jgi:hypothetical protein
MTVTTPFLDSVKHDGGVDHPGYEASGKQHQKHVAKRFGQT